MKKGIIGFISVTMLVVSITGMLYSCNGANTGESTSKADSLKENKVYHDTISDLSTFQLKGAVKSVAYKDDSYFENRIFVFSKNGTLQNDDSLIVERDSTNRIKMMKFPYTADSGVELNYVMWFKYDSTGNVIGIKDEDRAWSSKAHFSYNSNGYVETDSTKSFSGLSVTNYVYKEIDSHGNWTLRECVTKTGRNEVKEEKTEESRVITYYE